MNIFNKEQKKEEIDIIINDHLLKSIYFLPDEILIQIKAMDKT